ncbi:hypothetical protein WSM22_32840 [Cytophagales bacterium WSM2-2]|nr:hypothetical protein WSM22_32840 [Cytophagales bacterium WSM2-2]
MTSKECTSCRKTVATNETVKVNGNTYCNDCFATIFPDKDSLSGKRIEKDLDPTICARCTTDFGSKQLSKISRYPICDDCQKIMNSQTFPVWVRASLAGTLALVIIAFVWNWRYYQSYSNIKKANAAFEKADYPGAAQLMSLASEQVPEVDDIYVLASYYRGIDLLAKDKGSEALAEFEICKNKVPNNYNIDRLITQAKIGSSFDKKDYEGFLNASKENLGYDSTSAGSWTTVASAYSCLYATNGDESARAESLKCLDKAKAIDNTSKEAIDYYNIVEYRLYSKRVIRREDFIKEFPNGWTKN